MPQKLRRGSVWVEGEEYPFIICPDDLRVWLIPRDAGHKMWNKCPRPPRIVWPQCKECFFRKEK